ncbi:hypothetical protein N7510_011270 [Penicillium lagena]|uniref:uncharacterized protein n=1 Tax=Penicillium lagena TaxID=94218 RepID=UPI002540D9B7|nr:uncharacterized protein N7510_011270 [Penicillium lagena]KAJ5601736.1 hypothetical protein N7510_011270 [Penicillium lagena]
MRGSDTSSALSVGFGTVHGIHSTPAPPAARSTSTSRPDLAYETSAIVQTSVDSMPCAVKFTQAHILGQTIAQLRLRFGGQE